MTGHAKPCRCWYGPVVIHSGGCCHTFAAHQEHTTTKGFASDECCGEDTCTCSYYEPDQGDQ